MGRRVLWDSLPVLPAGGAQHRHSTEQPRQSAIRGHGLANRSGEAYPTSQGLTHSARCRSAGEPPGGPHSPRPESSGPGTDAPARRRSPRSGHIGHAVAVRRSDLSAGDRRDRRGDGDADHPGVVRRDLRHALILGSSPHSAARTLPAHHPPRRFEGRLPPGHGPSGFVCIQTPWRTTCDGEKHVRDRRSPASAPHPGSGHAGREGLVDAAGVSQHAALDSGVGGNGTGRGGAESGGVRGGRGRSARGGETRRRHRDGGQPFPLGPVENTCGRVHPEVVALRSQEDRREGVGPVGVPADGLSGAQFRRPSRPLHEAFRPVPATPVLYAEPEIARSPGWLYARTTTTGRRRPRVGRGCHTSTAW